MHECNSGSVLLVNAEVDSMGGVVDGGAGVGVETSPHRVAIEKAQAALRQEYDVREERRRELEFLEKGGNPLDFKFGNAACASVQSTSLTDQHPEQFVTSEVKGSFALTASPRGDSVESSGRPGTRTDCEPNSADNLLLFDGDNELPEHKKNSIRPGKRNNIATSKQSSQISGRQNGRVSEDSTIFRPYARRNRSKSMRDGTRSNSTELVHSRGGHGSLVSRGGSRDPKATICEANKQKEQKTPSFSNPKSSSSNGNIVSKIVTSDKQLDVELDGKQGTTISTSLGKGSLPESKLDVGASKGVVDNQQPQPTHVDGQQPPVDADAERPDLTEVNEKLLSAAIEGIPCAVTTVSGSEAGYGPENGSSNSKGDRKKIPNEVQNTSSAAFGMKGLDSESSCTQTSLCLDVNNDSDVCTNKRNVSSNGNSTEQKFKSEGSPNVVGGEILEETNETKIVDSGANVNDDPCSIYQNHVGNGSMVKVEEEIHPRVSGEQNQVNCTSNTGLENNSHSLLENDKRGGNVLGDSNDSIVNKENSSARRSQSFVDVSAHDLPVTALLGKDSVSVPDYQTSENSLNLVNKAREDSVLEEARIIEAKRQRIAELSVGTMPLENRRASHWEFVLEEMAWLANDFAQERLWKITAAAQMSRMAASASRLRFEKQNQHWKLKKVAHTLANAVMQFWHLAQVHLNSDISSASLENRKFDVIVPSCTTGNETSEGKIEKPVTTNKALEYSLGKSLPLAVQGYAVRFLKSASSPVPPFQAEAEATPEDITDIGSSDMSWEDRLTEEILFYTVPSGAMEAYKKSIESHLVQCENTCSSMQEEADTHMYDAIAEYGYQESTLDEDEGETSTYYLAGAFEGSKPSKFAQKKRNNLTRPYSGRSYEMATDVPYGHLTTGPQQSMPMGKRPATNLNVGAIPTKRMRTATRQRFVSPFGTGGTGGIQVPAKTDASSGDTSPFQDDQYTLHGESQMQRSVEVESATDFEKQMRYDSAETSTKPKKKKKKPKHLGTAYDQGWQLDSNVNRVQSNNFKKRTESHHFESNGTTGLYGQRIAKRPKIMKHPLDNAFDNIAHMNGSISSPAASVSNMSNPNKFIKLMGGRDRGRKAKGLKISAGQPGSGSPWTLFEDQALVVLVHDMGPNWDLVSDAVNTTLQFKCIFRKPKECKERHKILMDRSASDGADSAEDSGSSQSYPSSLPGIPKGSARQLFQCLQGPMVEDTLKSHFEKIIIIEQKQYYRRSQNDYQDPKQIAPVHNSHIIALSQAFPNNLNGSVLTPLDLCDTTPSSPDLLPPGYQGSQAGGLAMSNQSAVASALPTSGPNSSLQGSSSIALGSNLQSPTGPLGASVRDGRFGVPRTPTPDDHQRMQQYNQMLSGRNPQQPNLSVPGALSGSDRGVRLNGMGMMHGMSRPLPMARPGFPGMASSPILNSSTGGTPSPALHTGGVSGQGNSLLRPRDASHMMRPGHNLEHQRPTMAPELPMQTSQGSAQGLAPFNGLSPAFCNPATTPPLQTYAGHTQQPHPHHPHLQVPGPQQQAYAIRVAKERQKQRYMLQQQQQQQQQQLATQHQIPSSPMAQPVSVPPLTPSTPMAPIASPHQQKHHLQPGLGQNPQTSSNSGLSNQMAKQRQRPTPAQFQQSGRHHLQQRQHGQGKVLKGIGRGNVVNPNLPVDPSRPNGIIAAGEKGEQIVHPVQSQSPYSGSGLNSVQPSKPPVPSQSLNQSPPQQKQNSTQTQTKPLHQIPQLASANTSASHQAVAQQPQQQPPLEKPANPTQPIIQRVLQQNCQVQPDQPGGGPVDQAQDQQSVNNAPQIGTASAMPRTCTDSANADLAVSSVVTSQLKESESGPDFDSGMSDTPTQVACIGSPALSAGNDPIPTFSPGSAQKQLSGSVSSHEHNTVTQRLQQSLVSSPPSTQQHDPPLEQPSPTLQKERQLDQQSPQPHLSLQQQTQNLQSG